MEQKSDSHDANTTEAIEDVGAIEDVVCISFDIEATGMRPSKHAMVELGAAAGTQSKGVFAEFSRQIAIPEGKGFDEACEKEFWDVVVPEKKKQVIECETTPESAMRDFVDWVYNILRIDAGGNRKRVRFVGDNIAFDAKWVSVYLDEYADHEPLETFFEGKYQPLWDVNAYRRGAVMVTPDEEHRFYLEQGKKPSITEHTRARFKIEKRAATAHTHTAVDDARHILEEWFILLEHLS